MRFLKSLAAPHLQESEQHTSPARVIACACRSRLQPRLQESEHTSPATNFARISHDLRALGPSPSCSFSELRGIGSCRLQGHVRECQSAFVTTSCKGMIRRIFDELVFVAWRRSSRERLSKRFAVNSNSHGTWRSPCLLIYSACAGDHGQVQRCRVRSQSDRLCQA